MEKDFKFRITPNQGSEVHWTDHGFETGQHILNKGEVNYMEFSFDLLMQRDDITKASLSELLAEWGGEFFSQEPRKYKNNSGLVFEEFSDLNYYKEYYGRFLENDLEIDKYISLRLLGTHVFDLELILNKSNADISNNGIILLLQDLFKLDSFAIFFIRDEECIDIRKKVATEDELINVICSSLNWESPKGVLLTKNID